MQVQPQTFRPGISNPGFRPAFTLIELLVVVTIIVILLALVVPALDKAIYASNLAKCGTNLKTIAQGATMYATEFKRSYPQRVAVDVGSEWARVNILARGANQIHTDANKTPHAWDDRPRLFRNIAPGAFLDPLAGDISIEHTPEADVLLGNYTLLFGMTFTQQGGARLTRTSEKFKYDGHPSSVLAADLDQIQPNGRYGHFIWSSHGDADGRLQFFAQQGNPTWSFWYKTGALGDPPRGTADYNYAHKDGSVRRVDKVAWNDHEDANGHRTIRIPPWKDTTNDKTQEFVQLPRE